MIFLYSMFIYLFAAEDAKTVIYNKTPKSLFLIKKAKIESDVGEPIIPLFDRQKRMLLQDERIGLKNDN